MFRAERGQSSQDFGETSAVNKNVRKMLFTIEADWWEISIYNANSTLEKILMIKLSPPVQRSAAAKVSCLSFSQAIRVLGDHRLVTALVE